VQTGEAGQENSQSRQAPEIGRLHLRGAPLSRRPGHERGDPPLEGRRGHALTRGRHAPAAAESPVTTAARRHALGLCAGLKPHVLRSGELAVPERAKGGFFARKCLVKVAISGPNRPAIEQNWVILPRRSTSEIEIIRDPVRP
jgi:hypothetical protein